MSPRVDPMTEATLPSHAEQVLDRVIALYARGAAVLQDDDPDRLDTFLEERRALLEQVVKLVRTGQLERPDASLKGKIEAVRRAELDFLPLVECAVEERRRALISLRESSRKLSRYDE